MNEASSRWAINEAGGAGWCIHGVPYGPSWRCGLCSPGSDPTTVTLPPDRPRRRHITGRITPVDRRGSGYDVDLWLEEGES